ncbi:epoxide hydrolase [Microbacterium sp. STF-2]|uniref:epoxide hydrolase family protein n=1 Tax=Microbacterium sp. STF-2 TaxID=3031132 RepID=UPI002AFE6109|nr:epoxide hydrolase [Microbacterium sp. STF-2]MEA1263635.1 epoxide hydrolase [Microbacterium sp. STF-2]
MTQNTSLTPFRIDIPHSAVDDLHDRLTRTQWPLAVPGRDDRADFRRGTPLPYLKELAEYWRDGFDWRAQEATLNMHEQFTTVIEGQTFHVLHARSTNPQATPLLLSDSWPASFVEYLRLIPLLTDEFHVVIPSLPGLGFSNPLSGTGWDLARTAEAYAEIMTRFGYDRFGTHGTDVGTGITGRLAGIHPDRVIGTHFGSDRVWLGLVGNMFPAPEGLSEEELAQLEAAHVASAAERGYIGMHNHRPDTIGPALTDSPVGQLAWIVEKFARRIDSGHRAPDVDRDQLLTNVSLYWFTRSGASIAQFFYESEHAELDFAVPAGVPAGWAVFDAHPLIRRTMDPTGAISHWSEFTEGGHFPAMEEPELLAADIRKFFRSLA